MAHDPATGTLIWSYNALHDFETVNGVAAKGGAFDGGGPAVADGMVVVGSGMGFAGGAAGTFCWRSDCRRSKPGNWSEKWGGGSRNI